jgi:hypothetical protein
MAPTDLKEKQLDWLGGNNADITQSHSLFACLNF